MREQLTEWSETVRERVADEWKIWLREAVAAVPRPPTPSRLTTVSVGLALLVSLSPVTVVLIGGIAPVDKVSASSSVDSGIVYSASSDATVKAEYQSNGTEKWSKSFSSQMETVQVGPNKNVVYAGNFFDHYIVALDAETGNELWNVSTSDRVTSIAIDKSNDTVYFSRHGTQVVALYPSNGSQKWSKSVSDRPTDIAVTDDGATLYAALGGTTNGVVAINTSEQTNLWTTSGQGGSMETVSVDPENDSVYAGGGDNNLNAFYTTNGSEKWEYSYGTTVRDSEVKKDGSRIYLAGDNGDVHSLYENGTAEWSNTIDSSNAINSLSVNRDGTRVYAGFAATNNNVYQLYESNGSKDWTFSGHSDDVNGLSAGAAVASGSSSTSTGQTVNGTDNLTLDTRNFMEPNRTYPYTIYYINNSNRENVTGDSNTTIDIESVTHNGSQVLTQNGTGYLDTLNDSNVNATVNVTANYTTSSGSTLSTTEEIVVAAPTVENLAILPNQMIRIWAVVEDSTLFALLIAALLSVPASRFANSFAGLAVAELVIVIGWLGGYIGIGIAMLSVFTAIFIGLNLAQNTVQLRGGGFGR